MRNHILLKGIWAAFLGASLALVGCNKDDKPEPKKGDGFRIFNEKPNLPTLHFINQAGEPLSGAQVLIGATQNIFAGSSGAADENGDYLVPADWTTPQMMTVDAPGYIRATYLSMTPDTHVIVLRKKPLQQVELNGVTSDEPIKNKDGYIDFALVMGAMTRKDLLNFELQKVISPLHDKISVKGEDINVPANVSIPRQTENYLFFSITLDKPKYRLFYPDYGVQRVFAARGRFPFKSVVDGFRSNQEVFDMINMFSITGGSIRDVNLTSQTSSMDIPVMDLTFTDKRAYKAPKVASSQIVIALPASDSNGYLIPTDVKRLDSAQSANLNVWLQNPTYLAQVVKNKSEFESGKPGVDRLSAILLPFDDQMTSDYLPLIDFPTAKGHNDFIIPQVTSSLNKLTTYAVLSDVRIDTADDGTQTRTPTPVWEVYAPGWVSEIKLPEWAWTKSYPTTRFEVSLVGTASSDTIPLGPEMMEKATHVTRSSVDY
jgi:hypothetical protein